MTVRIVVHSSWLYQGFVVNFLYCLLSDKHRETYHSVFDKMKLYLDADNRVLQPETIIRKGRQPQPFYNLT